MTPPKVKPTVQEDDCSFTFDCDGTLVVFKLNGEDTAPSVISIRKTDGAGDPLIYLDGEKFIGEISSIDPSTIESMEVLKDEAAVRKYGEEAKNGVLLIKTKK